MDITITFQQWLKEQIERGDRVGYLSRSIKEKWPQISPSNNLREWHTDFYLAGVPIAVLDNIYIGWMEYHNKIKRQKKKDAIARKKAKANKHKERRNVK